MKVVFEPKQFLQDACAHNEDSDQPAYLQSDQSLQGSLWVAKIQSLFRWTVKTDQPAQI